MSVKNTDDIKAYFDALSTAADDLDFQKIGKLTISLFWDISECRDDFEEFPSLIAEHETAISAAAEDLDAVEFCNHVTAILSAIAERHAAKGSRIKITEIFAGLPAIARDLDARNIVVALRTVVDLLLDTDNAPRRLPVVLEGDRIRIGRHFTVRFRRTLRIPEDGKDYPLPPGFSAFPICKVEDYADKVPAHWLDEGGFFIPMHQREALYLEFGGAKWRPSAAKVGIGKINAITGDAWDQKIRKHKQDYVIVPEQQWLDGINSEDGRVRQFVAMPLGQGYTVEEQITDEARFGGIQVVAFDPKAGIFPDEDPQVTAERERRARQRREPKP